MANLYDTLGVAKDATADAIKKAFRSKAKKAHPDAGGDPKDFHALVKANDILSDPDKRQRYDETGEIDDKVDTTDSQAMSIIAAFVDRFLNDKDAKYKNMIGDLKKAIGDEITTAKRSIEEGRAYELRALDVRKRVKGKKGAALIGRMVDGQVENARRVIRFARAANRDPGAGAEPDRRCRVRFRKAGRVFGAERVRRNDFERHDQRAEAQFVLAMKGR